MTRWRKRRYRQFGGVVGLIYLSLVIIYKVIEFTVKTLMKIIKFIYRFIQNQRILNKQGLSMDQIYDIVKRMTGREFEIFCAELLKYQGYDKVMVTQATSDGGKDIILIKNGEKTYVECKRWDGEVGRPVLQKLVGSAYGDCVDYMICITTGTFNSNAFGYARKIDELTLMGMPQIMKMIIKLKPNQVKKIMLKSMNYDSKMIKLYPAT